ncbi:uncharacterized protein LOC132737600 [Ruditapes philippinarum]|uniref:uncharacterized protein LOC132737600 n=1 Tax=Ruditapes philippinarum TaxID=129788 RepID=UPI00295BF9FC|nr:uncharacterized protein LOC132737600 [Ruditapes philippinarum]
MNGYFIVLGIVYISVSTSKCECRRRRDKLRDKTKISQTKEDGIKYSRNVIDLIEELCLPSDTSRLFYRIQNESHIFVGFDDVKLGLVYSMSWKISKDNPEKLTGNNQGGFQVLSAIDVRKQMKLEHLLAAADQKVQDKFRVNISQCSQARIIKKTCVIQSLAGVARKMKEVNIGQNCKN